MAANVRIPSYRRHRARNLAVVTINGHDYYLGEYGSVESREKYGRLIAQHATGVVLVPSEERVKTALPSPAGLSPCGTTINELILAYFVHAEEYYLKDGKLTDEFGCQESAARPLLLLFGAVDCGMFGGQALKAVIEKMIDLGWCRKYINKSINRIRQMFRYGVAHDLFPPEVVARLDAVPPLLKGRTEAKELPERTPVPQEHIERVRKNVNEHTRDILDLALITGARPGELCKLTGEMIDRKRDVWIVDFEDHKTSHQGKKRVIGFGSKAQLILTKYLKADPRKKLFPISRVTFSDNLKASCIRLDIPIFTGHWLRHNALTAIRREINLDAAQIAGGHSNQKTTEIYAHVEPTDVIELARKRG